MEPAALGLLALHQLALVDPARAVADSAEGTRGRAVASCLFFRSLSGLGFVPSWSWCSAWMCQAWMCQAWMCQARMCQASTACVVRCTVLAGLELLSSASAGHRFVSPRCQPMTGWAKSGRGV
jgi:hypothetical protein